MRGWYKHRAAGKFGLGLFSTHLSDLMTTKDLPKLINVKTPDLTQSCVLDRCPLALQSGQTKKILKFIKENEQPCLTAGSIDLQIAQKAE